VTDELLAAGYGRDTTIVALGGGVVGDLAGFVAATYLRGVPVVQAPSTLLAMVDASVGGKTAVDTPAGKNLVGAFHPPAAVLVDPTLLGTLPPADLAAGAAEALKHGVIADARHFGDAAALLPALASGAAAGDPAVLDGLARVVADSVAIKAAVVAEDPREHGRRKTLNLGHTVGHAVELAAGYRIRHGEAVALGMVAECDIAERMGLAEPGTAARVRAACRAGRLPTALPPASPPTRCSPRRAATRRRAAAAWSTRCRRASARWSRRTAAGPCRSTTPWCSTCSPRSPRSPRPSPRTRIGTRTAERRSRSVRRPPDRVPRLLVAAGWVAAAGLVVLGPAAGSRRPAERLGPTSGHLADGLPPIRYAPLPAAGTGAGTNGGTAPCRRPGVRCSTGPAAGAPAAPRGGRGRVRRTTRLGDPLAEAARPAPPPPAGGLRMAASPLIMPRLSLPRVLSPDFPALRGLAARARPNQPVQVRLTAYCLSGTTRLGNTVRPGIVAADPRIFPLARTWSSTRPDATSAASAWTTPAARARPAHRHLDPRLRRRPALRQPPRRGLARRRRAPVTGAGGRPRSAQAAGAAGPAFAAQPDHVRLRRLPARRAPRRRRASRSGRTCSTSRRRGSASA
jgi:hypothetical protein